MSYKNAILFRPGLYPFLLATEADGIPMTLGELEALHAECERALIEYDEYEANQADMEPHKRDGFAEMMAEMADFERKAKRENGI